MPEIETIEVRLIWKIKVPKDGTCMGCRKKTEGSFEAACTFFGQKLNSDGEKYLPCDLCTVARLAPANRGEKQTKPYRLEGEEVR